MIWVIIAALALIVGALVWIQLPGPEEQEEE